MKPQRLLTIAGQISNQPLLSRNDVEALMEREARPDSPVLSVYLDTAHSDEVNLKRGFEVMFKNMLRDLKLPEKSNNQQELKEDSEVVLRFLGDYRGPKRAASKRAAASAQIARRFYPGTMDLAIIAEDPYVPLTI